jgi:hypothetical protein
LARNAKKRALGDGAIEDTSHSHARPALSHNPVVTSVAVMMVARICSVDADSAVKR